MEQFLHLPGIWYTTFFISLMGLLVLGWQWIELKYRGSILYDSGSLIGKKKNIIIEFTVLIFLLGYLVAVALFIDEIKEIARTSQVAILLLLFFCLLVFGLILWFILHALHKNDYKKVKTNNGGKDV